MAAPTSFDFDAMKKRMQGALDALRHEFSGLRTGRASVTLLDNIQVDAYGSTTPLNQVAGVNAPEPRLLTVQVWDRGVVVSVEKAIRASGLGLNPVVDGQTLRIPIPPLSGERRAELAKLAGKYAEASRVAVRNVRRDSMDQLKKLEKDGAISQDDLKKMSDRVQQDTDATIKQVDDLLKTKEEEIMQV